MTAELHRLSNGLTVAVEPMPGMETAAAGLYIDSGSRSEIAAKTGLAHMVEHMVFKGAGKRDAKAIAEDIEDVGGSLNAWTARDHTVFHARIMPADMALSIDMIADLVRAPWFDAAELEREKQVVLAELGESRDTPDDIVFDHLHAAAFADSALGRPVLGNEDSIGGFMVDDLKSWIALEYRPSNLVLAAAGKVDPVEFLKLAEARFGDLEPGKAPQVKNAAFTGGRTTDQRDLDQIHLAFAHCGTSFTADDLHPLSLFAAITGGGMASRLFQQVREQRGLAYSIYSWLQPFRDTGLFGVYCAANDEQAHEAYELARDVLHRAAEDLSEAELARAKAQGRAGLLMGLESVASRCDHLARQIQIHGRIVPPTELVAASEAVTVAECRATAQAMLSTPQAFATVGAMT